MTKTYRKPIDQKVVAKERAAIAQLGAAELQQLRAHAVARIAEVDAALKRLGVSPPTSERAPITLGPSDPLVVDRVTMGRLLGCHPDRVSKYTTERGLPVLEAGDRNRLGKYDAITVLAWYRSEMLNLLDERAERARKDKTIADLGELRLARERGKVISREQAGREGRALAIAVKAHLLALARRMEQLGLVVPEHRPAVEKLCREACAEMARWSLADLAGQAPA